LRDEENVNFELLESLQYMSKHFKSASTHWLRHTCGSHAVSMGVNIRSLQTNLGHKSIETTSIYTDQEDGKRVDEMSDFLERSFII
jgi:site-specific recombinase XerD